MHEHVATSRLPDFGGVVIAIALAAYPTASAIWSRCVVAALNGCGFHVTGAATSNWFFVDEQPYEVTIWCTPLPLLALFFLGQSFHEVPWRTKWPRSLCAMLLLPSAVLANIIVSIQLHHRAGFPWAAAHWPGLIGVYVMTALLLGRKAKRTGSPRAASGPTTV